MTDDGGDECRADQAQLLEWTLELPDAESVRSAAASLAAAGFAAEIAPERTAARTRDPWGTPLALVVPTGTVKTRLMHARAKLRAALKGEDHE